MTNYNQGNLYGKSRKKALIFEKKNRGKVWVSQEIQEINIDFQRIQNKNIDFQKIKEINIDFPENPEKKYGFPGNSGNKYRLSRESRIKI